MSITITVTDDAVILAAPYDAELPARARKAGGRFNGATKAWHFHARDEQRVRDLARDIYGTDGSDADQPTYTLRVQLVGLAERQLQHTHERSLSLLGRELVWRPSRDEQVRLGAGVVLVAGELEDRGGSVRYPAIGEIGGVVLEVRDVVQSVAERAVAEHPGAISLVGVEVDHDALRAERAQLLARLDVIAALLKD